MASFLYKPFEIKYSRKFIDNFRVEVVKNY